MPSVLLINGASGTGKTTTASMLSQWFDGAVWIHPDQLWDTPRMTSEAILRLAFDRIPLGSGAPMAIIDCQIRGSHARRILSDRLELPMLNILLTCQRKIREQRLLERGWDGTDFERVDAWAKVLLEDAAHCKDMVADTSTASTSSVCATIMQRMPAWLNG